MTETPKRPPGRPRLGAEAMTATERMQRSRARQAQREQEAATAAQAEARRQSKLRYEARTVMAAEFRKLLKYSSTLIGYWRSEAERLEAEAYLYNLCDQMIERRNLLP